MISSLRRWEGCTGTTRSGCIATLVMCRLQSSSKHSMLGLPAPKNWPKSNELSLHQTQGASGLIDFTRAPNATRVSGLSTARGLLPNCFFGMYRNPIKGTKPAINSAATWSARLSIADDNDLSEIKAGSSERGSDATDCAADFRSSLFTSSRRAVIMRVGCMENETITVVYARQLHPVAVRRRFSGLSWRMEPWLLQMRRQEWSRSLEWRGDSFV